MNREIRFRGKCVRTGEWVDGHLLLGNSSSFIVTMVNTINGHILTDCRHRVVIPETVGQLTGLKDKNGVEIYEGDIVHYKTNNGNGLQNYNEIAAVEWEFGEFCLNGPRLKYWGFRTLSAVNGSKVHQDALEVIGNIHEYPDLLKEAPTHD